VIRDMVVMLFVVIATVCIVLVGIGVIHDMSDGKADGIKYVNGCETK